ncbi:hypothetical protein [Paenibacillus sp. FSL H3-0286]|uniref:hypothetical protein n=1 Tax=Paenibacillus sp. FSL H3-0286 TaxID=2921427 RepID=UPI0032542ACE
MIKMAVVKHNNNTMEYVFKTDLDLNKDDLVVCDTQRGYETARVLRTYEVESSDAKKWIVSKVDLSNHVSKVNKENEINSLKVKIDIKRDKCSKEVINSLIGQVDSEMASLLNELKQLEEGKDKLLNEFYFKNSFGVEFKATLREDESCYLIVNTSLPTITASIMRTKAVQECITEGTWKVI